MMGLALARIGNALSTPMMKAAVTGTTATTAATGIVLGGQYAYGEEFAKPQTAPGAMNYVVGLSGGIGGGIGAASAAGWASGYSSRSAKPGVAISSGIATGALAGAFLVAPVLRRMAAD